MSSGMLFPLPELTTSRAFPGRDPKPTRAGRGWGREPRLDVDGRLVMNAKSEVATESWGGHIEYYRADKYALDRRVSPVCKSIIEHIIGETISAPTPKPEWADIPTDDFRAMTGKSQRAIEVALVEGMECGIIERQFPEKRYDKGGYKVRLDRILAVPLRKPPPSKPISASLLGKRDQAALRIRPAKTADERAQQIAALERKIAEIRGLDNRSSAESCAPVIATPLESVVLPAKVDNNIKEIQVHNRLASNADPCAPDAAQSSAQPGLTHAAAAGAGPQPAAHAPEAPPVALQGPAQAPAAGERPQPGALLTQISVPGPHGDVRPNATYCPWDWDCPYLRSRNQETTPSSSSVGDVTRTTTTEPAAAPDPSENARIQVRDAARQYAAVDPAGLDQLLKACAPHDADAICAGIHAKGRMATTKKNPFGFLLTAVPNWLKDPENVRLVREAPRQCPACGAVVNEEGGLWRCPRCGKGGES